MGTDLRQSMQLWALVPLGHTEYSGPNTLKLRLESQTRADSDYLLIYLICVSACLF